VKLYPEDESTKTHRNAGNYLPNKTVQKSQQTVSFKSPLVTTVPPQTARQGNCAVTVDYLICQGCRRSCRMRTALHISLRTFSKSKSTSWIKIDQLDVTCFIVSLFTAQHVSNVSTSIFRSLRLIVGLSHGLYSSGSICVGVTVWFGWGGVVSLCRLKRSFVVTELAKQIQSKFSQNLQTTQPFIVFCCFYCCFLFAVFFT
jgi:hypothetical protein